MENTLIATVSTFLSHYFNPTFILSGWLAELAGAADDPDLRTPERRLVEMKTRFLYCIKATIESLARYEGRFRASAAYEEDRITDALVIISTPEHSFTDDLLNRCTDVMLTDLSSVGLDDAVAGQFLRRVFQMIRQDVGNIEHLKFMYLFCIWTMPEVLFEASVAQTVRSREVRALMADPRMPADLVQTLRTVRGGGIFTPSDEEEPMVDEGWDLEAPDPEPPRRSAWSRLFGRSGS